MSNSPCASFGRSARTDDSQTCPYIKHQPHYEEGAQAWDLILTKSGRQLRIADSCGVIGIDMTANLMMARACGYDQRALSYLLPFIENGIIEALNNKESNNSDVGKQ